MKDTRRSINSKFWIDPDVEDMSKEATYLFMGLLTFPENNMAGVYEISDKRIESYTKMKKPEILVAMNELSNKNKIMRHGSWVCIRNHIKNQKLNHNMMMAVIKDLCPSPLPVKIWVLSKQDSTEPEDWVESAVFSVNCYYSDQKVRIAKKASNNGRDVNLFNETMLSIPDIAITKADLLKILTNPLPFKPEELTKHSSMVTLTQRLDNLLVNMNENRNMKYELEDRSMNNEYEKRNMNNEGNSIKKENPSPFEQWTPQQLPASKIDAAITHWNSIQGLPKTRKLSVNLGEKAKPIIESVKLYSLDEIKTAIDNYAQVISNDQRYKPIAKYGDVFGFLSTGIDKYWDEANPLDLMLIFGSRGIVKSDLTPEEEQAEADELWGNAR